MFKIDLHTHSILSPDGGLTESDYRRILQKKILDCVAITDHNDIAFAVELQKKLGDHIIVGEEIMTRDGEIIGLYLSQRIASGLSAQETVLLIHQQNGIVLVPHPFETVRKGLSVSALQQIVPEVDCLEVYNARSLQAKTAINARETVKKAKLVAIASSDSHCMRGIGSSYLCIKDMPTQKTLLSLCRQADLHENRASLLSFICPKWNVIRKKIGIVNTAYG